MSARLKKGVGLPETGCWCGEVKKEGEGHRPVAMSAILSRESEE